MVELVLSRQEVEVYRTSHHTGGRTALEAVARVVGMSMLCMLAGRVRMVLEQGAGHW